MNCSDVQFDLTFYADGTLGEDENLAIASHLDACPLCREAQSEYREISASLRMIRRPEISLALKRKITDAVRGEIFTESRVASSASYDLREWLQMRVMPYSVGVFASVLVGVTLLTMMFTGRLQPARVDTAISRPSTILLATNRDPYADMAPLDVISPADFARGRMEFAAESPSINPQGALIALTKSLVRGGMNDDEVVVVADVFSNGLARVAEVVEPSHNKQAVLELERALDSDPAFAPFVPSQIESRPESVRVILKFQSVNVSTRERRNRRL